jgi:hypothetical protein
MNPIERAFSQIVGRPCWGVKRAYGSFLTMEFGPPRLLVRQPMQSQTESRRVRRSLAQRRVHVRGRWHLWIYGCDWSLRLNGKVVGDSSTKKRIDRATSALEGQELVAVKISDRGARTSFVFDLGGELETRPYDRCSEQWLLFGPNHRALIWRADRRYSHAASNRPVSRLGWRRLPAG